MSHVTIPLHLQTASPAQATVTFWAVPSILNMASELKNANPDVLFQKFADAVCPIVGCTPKGLTSQSRKEYLVRARGYISLLMRLYTPATLLQIANMLGGRDHTTIIHIVRTIKSRIELEDQIADQWKQICRSLQLNPYKY